MNKPVLIAVTGAGLVGKRHINAIMHCRETELCAIVDPSHHAKPLASALGSPWYPSLTEMFAKEKPDGVILATPNKVHVENGLECISSSCPVLVEKPLATSADEAAGLVDQARIAGIPILVGHHRRHNALVRKARELIDSGRLGRMRAVHTSCWLYKPDDYFNDAPWRKTHGAGPISVNLVHDVDLIRYLCGDVVSVQAQSTVSVRGHENEDAAAAVVRFANGAIGTISVSDAIVSPWSWELTARENPVYPPTPQSSYMIGGTHGSLSLPDLTLWENKGKRSWWSPISATSTPRDYSDPFISQIKQFAAVIAGLEEPLVSGEEGLKTLRVIEAIQSSARSGDTVCLDHEGCN